MAVEHIVITGMTGTGKTLLARCLGALTSESNRGVIVYDPTAMVPGPNAAGWRADYVASDWGTFVQIFWGSRNCLAIIDEAADVFEDDRSGARRIMRRGRHIDPATNGGGHVVCLIGQRWTNLDKSARDQARIVYAFAQAPSDGQLLADHWNQPLLAQVADLPNLHYLRADRDRTIRRGYVHVPK